MEDPTHTSGFLSTRSSPISLLVPNGLEADTMNNPLKAFISRVPHPPQHPRGHTHTHTRAYRHPRLHSLSPPTTLQTRKGCPERHVVYARTVRCTPAAVAAHEPAETPKHCTKPPLPGVRAHLLLRRRSTAAPSTAPPGRWRQRGADAQPAAWRTEPARRRGLGAGGGRWWWSLGAEICRGQRRWIRESRCRSAC